MGIAIPRPAMRKREARLIAEALAAHDERTSFRVIDLTSGACCGLYATLDEAHGCVAFDGLSEFQIWRGNVLIECVELDEREAW